MSYLTNSYILNSSIYGSVDYFVIKVKTDNTGTTASNQINIPTSGAGYNCSIDFGDGTGWQVYSGTAPTITYTYAGSGVYTIKIKENVSGGFPRIFYNNTGDRLKVLSIEQWGSIHWTSMDSAFYGCSNMVVNATDVPDLSSVSTVSSMFRACTTMTSLNLSNWNFSSVSVFGAVNNGFLYGCSALTSVNLTGVTMRTAGTYTLTNMFFNCTNLSTITNLKGLFNNKCTSTSGMFTGCSNLGAIDLSNVDLSGCTTFGAGTGSGMFYNCGVTSLNVTNMLLSTTSNVTIANMCRSTSSLTTIIGFNTLNTSKVISMDGFLTSSGITSLDMSGMDFSSCITFANFLSGATSISSLNMTGVIMNTTASFGMANFSMNTTSLSSITGFNGLNLSKCTTLASFNSGGRLTSIDLSTMDLSSCTTMTAFAYNNTALTSVNLSNTNLSACTSFGAISNSSGAFSTCSALTSVNMTGTILNTTSNFTAFAMFYLASGSALLTFNGLSGCNWGKCTAFNNFANGRKLDTTEYSNWLIELANDNTNTGVTLNVSLNTKYDSSAVTARSTLTTTRTWTITDGGLV